MSSLLQHLRFAFRQLRKSPGFTFTVIVTLALGIGANAAVFTLFDQVLLRMLPVQKPNELVRFEWCGAFRKAFDEQLRRGDIYKTYFSYPMYWAICATRTRCSAVFSRPIGLRSASRGTTRLRTTKLKLSAETISRCWDCNPLSDVSLPPTTTP